MEPSTTSRDGPERNRALSAEDVVALVAELGEAPAVAYAPPSIYPMSAPAFDRSAETDRGAPSGGPLGVYVHVPYCNYHCTFCFYATGPVPAREEMARHVDALARELSWIPPGTELTQLYVGGGTPTTLPPDLLDRLLGAVFARVADPGRHAHTVECSPESVSPAHVEALRRHGVRRVSMGIQSTEERVLRVTNRRHDGARALDACDLLVGSGLVVNVDLIYGLPGQTEDGFAADFEAVAARGVHSVTGYHLRVNERTPIGRLVSPEGRLDAAALVRWRERVRDVATTCGFDRTRWHTWRRRDLRDAPPAARAFRDVTGVGDQLGAGVSARSRLSDVVYRNHADPATWLARVEAGRSPVEGVQRLDEAERRLRFVTLTLGDGLPLDPAAYERAFGTRFDDDYGEVAARLAAAGVLASRGGAWSLTERGALVFDLATRAFYPRPVRRRMDERQSLAGVAPNLRPSKAAR
jgi:oxygen-independent coproporphyrinogen-3 oxidase